MPLTEFQIRVANLLKDNRTTGSHLAGGAAILLDPTSTRFSNDLDYFHDTLADLTGAVDLDIATLQHCGLSIAVDQRQPGFVRAVVSEGAKATKLEWVHDASWRFLPVVAHVAVGTILQPIDLATNKVLALAGRNEPRDLLDVIYLHETVLSLGALCWASAGKDPGYTPHGIVEQLRRRGKYRQSDFDRLMLTSPVDLVETKRTWLTMLDEAQQFVDSRPGDEIGCIYLNNGRVVAPQPGQPVTVHHGSPGGSAPKT